MTVDHDLHNNDDDEDADGTSSRPTTGEMSEGPRVNPAPSEMCNEQSAAIHRRGSEVGKSSMICSEQNAAVQRGSCRRGGGGAGEDIHEIRHLAESSALVLTIDSGASENAISEAMASQYPAKPLVGSQRGLMYMAANGTTMANRGGKDVTFWTGEGYGCMLKMQVTDVTWTGYVALRRPRRLQDVRGTGVGAPVGFHTAWEVTSCLEF